MCQFHCLCQPYKFYELHKMTHENILQIVNHKKTSLVIAKTKKEVVFVVVIINNHRTQTQKELLPDRRTTRGRNHHLNSKSAPKLAFRDHTQDYKLLTARKNIHFLQI